MTKDLQIDESSLYSLKQSEEAALESEPCRTQHGCLLRAHVECASVFRNLTENSALGVYIIQDGRFKYVNPKMSQIFGYTVEELLSGIDIKTLILPEDLPLAKKHLGMRVSAQVDPISYRIRGVKKNREVIYLEIYDARMNYQGSPAVLGSLIEATKQVESEATLARELSKFQALYDLAVSMTSDRELDETLMMVVEQTRNLLGSDTAYLALRDEAAKQVYMHTLSGVKTEAFKKMRLAFGEGLGGEIASTGKSLIVKDYFQEIQSPVHGIVSEEGLVSGLAVPVQIAQTSLGVLYAFNRSSTSFSKSDLDTLSLLGNLAAIEIIRKRQQIDLQKASEELERKVQERTTELCEANEHLKKEISERKKAEEALGRNELMLRDILATSPVGIGLTEKRIIKWANASWLRMFGFDDEKEFVGKSTRILYPSHEEYEEVGRALYCNLRSGAIGGIDAVFRRLDGSLFHGHIRIKAIDPSDLSKGAISAISDISDRKQAEHALCEAQQRLELALTGADLAWWDWDIVADKAVLSERGAEIFGYSLADIEPSCRFWQGIVHPDDLSHTMSALQEHFEGRSPMLETEHRLRSGSGEWKWAIARGKVVERDEQGAPLRMAGTILDITDRKLAEETVRLSEQRFRTVFEEAEDFIFLKDRSLKFIDVNPSAERFLGVSPPRVIGTTCEDWFSPEEAHRAAEIDRRVLKGESIQEEHSHVINGDPLILLTTRVPLRDDSGAIVGILGISRDITDRKRIEPRIELIEEYPSKAMQHALKIAHLASQRDTTVLLTGESGSGKDYLAKFIHDHSSRANRPYFSLNCAAIASHLAESELFGHEKGAFTGAIGRKRGMLELAEGGTLLLNEIGELSVPLQAKLLTFLDTKMFNRVGGEKQVLVDVRLIAATNRNLEEETEKGRFRKDLFFRINVMRIEVPPLRNASGRHPAACARIVLKASR